MIVVDASAVIALLFGEPSSAALAARLAADADRVMSAASYIDAGTVLAGRRRSDRLRAIDDLDTFLAAAAGIDPRISYGRGMGHGGALNFGDAFSYALAKSLEAPLLFVGDDFVTTDLTSAFAPDRG
jgi:ribonuclease VapC